MNLPAGFEYRSGQRLEKQMPVLVATKDIFAVIASVNDVVDCTFVLQSELSGHDREIAGNEVTCQY